jgi:hypothetical protein
MRRFLANVLFLFIGLPLTLSALMLLSARPWVLDRATYKRIALDDRLYAALQAPEIAAHAPRTFELESSGVKLVLDGPALVATAQKDLPWPEIKATASRGVDAAMDVIERGDAGKAALLDLRPLKAALEAKTPAAARDYSTALAAEIKAGTAAKLSTEAKPELLQIALAQETARIPDSAKIERPSPPMRRSWPLIGVISRGPENLSQALLNRMTATAVALSALIIAGLGALGGTNLVSRLSRAGKYLLVPSIVVLGVGMLLAVPGGLILQNILPAGARTMMTGQAGAQMRAYLASVLGPIARSFFITGLVGASAGGVLLSTKRFSEPRELE